MTVNSYEIDANLHLAQFEPEQAVERWKQSESVLWLDVEGPDRSEQESWLERFQVDGLARRLCLDFGDRPGLYPLKKELVLVIPMLLGDAERPEVQHLTCLCREGLLLN